MRKLTHITFTATPRIPGLRAGDLVTIECDNPAGALKDWRAVVRPGFVFLVSPRGWTHQNASRPKDRDPKGPCVTVQLAIDGVTLQWQTDEADLEETYKCGKYESQPFGWRPMPVADDKAILEQIPLSQIGDA